MNEQKLRGLLGLCVRARQAVFGMDGCLNAVRGGNAGALLLDEGASAGTADKYASACRTHGVPLIRLPKGLLGEATGKPGVAAAIQPGGFTTQILSLTAAQAAADDHQYNDNHTEKHIGGASVE